MKRVGRETDERINTVDTIALTDTMELYTDLTRNSKEDNTTYETL
jgi:hypothetical protein